MPHKLRQRDRDSVSFLVLHSWVQAGKEGWKKGREKRYTNLGFIYHQLEFHLNDAYLRTVLT